MVVCYWSIFGVRPTYDLCHIFPSVRYGQCLKKPLKMS